MLHSQNAGLMVVHRMSKSSMGGRACSYQASIIWNQAQVQVLWADTLSVFMNKLETFLFDKGRHRPANCYAVTGLDCWGISYDRLNPFISLSYSLLLLLFSTLSFPSNCITNFTHGSFYPSLLDCLLATWWPGPDGSGSSMLSGGDINLCLGSLSTSPNLHSKRQSGLESWPQSLSGSWTLLFKTCFLIHFSCFYIYRL